MWKFITSGPPALRRRLRAALAVAALTLLTSAPSHAAVEYVKICSLYGAGFFYIPGTDTCIRVGGRAAYEFNYAQPFARAWRSPRRAGGPAPGRPSANRPTAVIPN